MRQISCQIVGDNLKGEIAPFLFHFLLVERKSKDLLWFIFPHLVDMVVHLLDENER